MEIVKKILLSQIKLIDHQKHIDFLFEKYKRKNTKREFSLDEKLFYVAVYLTRYKEFKDFINSIDNTSLSINEKIYQLYTKNKPISCDNGNFKKFSGITDGYSSYCTKNCQCSISDNVKHRKNYFDNLSEAEWKVLLQKKQDTYTKNTGYISHPLSINRPSSEDYKKGFRKRDETMIKLYGNKIPLRCPEIISKLQKTNNEKYGTDYVGSSEQVKNKRISTNNEKYGTNYTLSLSEIREEIKKTNIERYGFHTPSMNSNIKEKISESGKQTCIVRYGVSNISQIQLSPLAREILSDKQKFKIFMEHRSMSTAAKELQVSTSTIGNYINNLDINFEYKSSSYEREIAVFLTENNIQFIERDRTLIKPLELDFYLPEHNLAIEFNGLYWHSDKKKENDYHYNKWKMCNEAGVRLLMINEDEWNNRADSIKRKILNVCGRSERGVGARKLSIRKINNREGQDFCEIYHIQGKPATVKYAYGAFNNKELVGVMLFNQQRNTQRLELIRFCTDGKTYAGLFSKIFSNFVRD
jgi:very-short-patch-repair endonuclease